MDSRTDFPFAAHLLRTFAMSLPPAIIIAISGSIIISRRPGHGEMA